MSLTGNGTDFSISATPDSRTIAIAQKAAFTLTVAPAGGFTGVVSLGCSGGPAAATCAITPTSLTLDGSSSQTANVTINFATNSDTKGTFNFTLTASSGGLSRSTQVSVTVKQ